MGRADPTRIAEAKQAGMIARLRDILGTEEAAERLMAAYHQAATGAGLSPVADEAYWREAEAWIATELERQGTFLS